MNAEQRKWLNAAVKHGGSFVSTFAHVCYAADDENFAILEPVLLQLMVKYPQYSNMKVGD